MYVCMCVYVCVCMYVCKCVYTYVFMYVTVHVYMVAMDMMFLHNVSINACRDVSFHSILLGAAVHYRMA